MIRNAWTDEEMISTNGICLSPLYDKAFDKGYIGIRPDDYTVIISKELKNYKKHLSYQNCFAPIEDKPIMLPNKHNPNPEFLAYHIEHIFVKHN